MTEMSDVDHTHPHTNETFTTTFRRGVAVAADGGERESVATMEDVHHEAPTEGAHRAFERGTEGRTETV